MSQGLNVPSSGIWTTFSFWIFYWGKIYLGKILTFSNIFQRTAERYQVHCHRSAAITAIRLQSFLIPPHWSLCPHYIPPLRLRQEAPTPPPCFLSPWFDCSRGLMKVGHTALVFLGLAEFPLFLHLYLDFYFSILFQIKTLTVQINPGFSKWTCCAKLAKDTTTSHRLQTLLPLQGWSFAHGAKPLYWPWLGSGRALFSIIIISLPKENLNCAESEQPHTLSALEISLYQAGLGDSQPVPCNCASQKDKWVGSIHKQNISGPPNLGQGN